MDALETLILGVSDAARRLRAELRTLARTRVHSLLVLGETGVGKDLVARALCACAPERYPHVEVFNCPAVPADHLESELFGTRRGAYPGALDRAGAAERADGGVLFLDEIGAMTGDHQARVLRLLESGEVRRLGGVRARRVEISVIAATNEDLATRAVSGAFREDLYYRLVQDGVLRIPPLRERIEDVPVLATAFLERIDRARPLSDEALARLRRHDWPGNVRELRAVLAGAARLCAAARIGAVDVDVAIERIRAPVRTAAREAPSARGAACFYRTTEAHQRRMLVDALEAAGGNQTLAGLLLGLHAARHPGAEHDLRARKLAHRKFAYWWQRLVEAPATP